MTKNNNITMINFNSFFNLAMAYIVGVVGYHLNNHSVFWGIVDALFYPIVVINGSSAVSFQ